MSIGGMFLDLVDDLLGQPRLAEGAVWSRRRFAPGELLTTQGAQGYSLFIVQSGRLAVLGAAPGSEVVVAELTEGDVIGQSSLIEPYESIATVRALTEGEVIEISGVMLSVYLDDHPQQGYLFYKYLLASALDNLAKTNRGLVDLATCGATSQGLSGADR